MWKRIGLTLAVVAALVLGTVAATMAADGGNGDAAASLALDAKVADTGDLDKDLGDWDGKDDGEWDEFFEKCEIVFEEEGFFFDEELTPELVDEINAETDALVAHLAAAGFTVDVVTDENGIREPVFEEFEEDEALWAAVEAFWMDQFAAEVAEWSDEEKAEWNAEIDAFVAEMAAEGITVETTEIAPGVFDIVWTEDLDKDLDDWDDKECAKEHHEDREAAGPRA